MAQPNFYRKVIKIPSAPISSSQSSYLHHKKPQKLRNKVFSKNELLVRRHENTEVRELEETGKEEQNVLVINGSTDMASAITRQLLIALPQANIMYAPTIELAGWMLKTRKIQLIISSEVLPDGGAHKLHTVLRQLKVQPPDILMVGRSVRASVQRLRKAGYRLLSRKTLNAQESRETTTSPHTPIQRRRTRPINERVSNLSADLRNDLNNPLQEIVTMAFVARQTREQQALSNDALLAIEKAASQLAGTVDGLEDRIKRAVSS